VALFLDDKRFVYCEQALREENLTNLEVKGETIYYRVMRLLFFFVFTSTLSFANPMKMMDQRIKTYHESLETCSENVASPDDGLFIDVSCEFKCLNQNVKLERSRGAFVPKHRGLFPGNGSNEKNILWSAVGVSMKTWSQRICFEKAAEACKGLENVESAQMNEMESGEWKLNRFPGCHEKGLTLSPFGDSIKSNRIFNTTALGASSEQKFNAQTFKLELSGLSLNLPFANMNNLSGCQKIIKVQLCFGDCIDLNAKLGSEAFRETLGTNDPLGVDHVQFCADSLENQLKDKKISQSLRRDLCETYFWDSFLADSKGNFKSCAAVRGETSCENF
jgi:hypothetical protein